MPEGFDPLRASRGQLELYGFPPRPDKVKHTKHAKNSKHAARWEKLMSRRFKVVPPTFEIIDGGGMPLPTQVVKTAESSTSSSWCGAVITGSSFIGVSGEWIVPNPCPTSGDDKTYVSYACIGIDGWTSSDNVAAGTSQQVEFSNSSWVGTSRAAFAWYQWYPALSVKISNFTVNFGDTIDCSVWSTSDTNCTIWMYNWGTNVSTSFAVTAPDDTTLVGDSVRWIMGAASDSDGNQYPMPNIQTTFFSNCYAETDSSDSSDSDSNDNDSDSDDTYDLSDVDNLVYMITDDANVGVKVVSDSVLSFYY
jgi:hypothetical protein